MLKEHKKEIQRWLKNPNEPKLWVKCKFNNNNKWFKIGFEDCSWSENCHYIVNDKHAKLRKLQIDKPSTVFEYYNKYLKKWLVTAHCLWTPGIKYRVKSEFSYPIFKVANKGTSKEVIVKFTGPKQGIVVFKMPDSPYYIGYESEEWFEHTNDYWQDVAYNPVRGLHDKQLIICWNGPETDKVIRFYDAKNDCTFTTKGCRKGTSYTNYLSYPLPDDKFLIETYRELED